MSSQPSLPVYSQDQAGDANAESQAELLKLAGEYIEQAAGIDRRERKAIAPEVLDVSSRFSFAQGHFSRSGLIVGLPDTHADHKEAVGMFVGLIRDIAGELATHPAWQMEILNETGKPVFRLTLLGESLA